MHPVTVPLRTNKDTGARDAVNKEGFHLAWARPKGPRWPNSHTQEVTGCLDLEQDRGQGSTGRNRQWRHGQECPDATLGGGHRWESTICRTTEEPAGRVEAWLEEDKAGPSPERLKVKYNQEPRH